MTTRSLKIEMAGDPWRKTWPKIRIQGQWLAKLGFPPGCRVAVVPMATGEIMLRAYKGGKPDSITTLAV
jgi:hypothetical protein